MGEAGEWEWRSDEGETLFIVFFGLVLSFGIMLIFHILENK